MGGSIPPPRHQLVSPLSHFTIESLSKPFFISDLRPPRMRQQSDRAPISGTNLGAVRIPFI